MSAAVLAAAAAVEPGDGDDGTAKLADPIFSRLLHAADRILENPAFDPADSNLVVTAILQTVARADREMTSALRQAELRRRDALIRELAARHYTGSRRAVALALVADAGRYAATAWRFHRHSASCPEGIRGTAQEMLWAAFKAHGYFPTSARQIENIIR